MQHQYDSCRRSGEKLEKKEAITAAAPLFAHSVLLSLGVSPLLVFQRSILTLDNSIFFSVRIIVPMSLNNGESP